MRQVKSIIKSALNMRLLDSKYTKGILMIMAIWMMLPSSANASHIVGGDLTYRCLGNNMWEIRLTMRRDCFLGEDDAPFDDPASIGFYDATTNQLLTFIGFQGQLFLPLNEEDTLNQIFISDCTISGNDVCVEQTTYVGTIFLPRRPAGYIMAYQRCCRNQSLNNVVNPLNTGSTLVALLGDRAQLECDNSPQFQDYPPIYICVNEPINFDHSAIDSPEDSLVYRLCTPFAGGDMINNMPQPPANPPYDMIAFLPPYSLANVMGGDALQMDPQTGFLTGTPGTVGQFVVGVCVDAYRGGVLINSTRREFQYNVRLCRDVPLAAFDAPNLTCDQLTVSFTNQSENEDFYGWVFDYGNPSSGISTEENPTYTFPASGYYDVGLVVFDIDSTCSDTIVQTIAVFESELNANFEIDVSDCSEQITVDVTDLSSDPDFEIVSWEWLLICGFDIQASAEQNPMFTLGSAFEGCQLTLQVTDENGCTADTSMTFDVRFLELQLAGEAVLICNGESTNLLLNGDPELTYTWSPETNLDLTSPWDPIASPSKATTYYVTVTDGLCEISDSITINVQQKASLEFDVFTDCQSLTITTSNSSMGNFFFWDFGDPNTLADTSNEKSPTYTYAVAGNYIITLASRDGCDTTLTKEITVSVISDTLDSGVISCFQESVNLNNEFNSNYTYSWSPVEFLDDATSGNPLATVEDDTWFFVTITDNEFPGCSIVDSALVIVNDDFTVMTMSDTAYCEVQTITLSVTSSVDPGTCEWSLLDGTVIGSGPQIEVTPLVTTSYVVECADTLGCSKSDTITLFPMIFDEIVASSDTAYCDVQTITISATGVAEGFVCEWYLVDGTNVGSGPEIDVTPEFPTTYIVVCINDLGCLRMDSVTLTPIFFDLEFGEGSDICLGDDAILFVNNMDPTQDLCYTWTPESSIITSPDSNVVVVMPSVTTTYNVLVENKALGCSIEMSFTVTVWNFDPLDVIITADIDTVLLGDDVQLTVNQDPEWTYEWSSVPPSNINNVFNPIVTPPSVGNITYTVTVTNDGGCTAVASYVITVPDPECNDEDIFLPNAFSPNDDDINDVLFVRSKFVMDLDLHIYNRWGQEVFVSKNQADGWDGTFGGKLLAPDVYGFHMTVGCPNGKEFFKKGNITLLR